MEIVAHLGLRMKIALFIPYLRSQTYDMDLTAAQKRLIESDESVRQKEREANQNPGDSQSVLRYAVEYLRNNPEIAQQAGINAFTPEDIQALKHGFNELLEMLRWVDDRTGDYSFWDNFPEEFPVKVPSEHADPTDPHDYYRGGWARIDEIADNVKKIFDKSNDPRESGILGKNIFDRI